MKTFLMMFSLMVLVFASACGPKTKADDVAKSLAKAMCDKQKECSPGSAFASEICEQGLTLGYGNALKGKGVPTADFEACISGFKAHDCTQLQMNKLPAPCSTFIKTF